ncbi:MAG: hypothetical protein ABFS35_10810 [Bacteroidota bacterium]
MAKIIGVITGFVVFFIWMNIVGNPHVVETVLGLIISIVLGFFAYKQIDKFNKK